MASSPGETNTETGVKVLAVYCYAPKEEFPTDARISCGLCERSLTHIKAAGAGLPYGEGYFRHLNRTDSWS